ncbi:MAG: hypothetical protein OEX02_19745 [Cyclobacteriaceae bacterium]|nr:hypothetical protein [Cyclobacteriaceae bacterium]
MQDGIYKEECIDFIGSMVTVPGPMRDDLWKRIEYVYIHYFDLLSSFHFKSLAERYQELVRSRPEWVQRISQKDLASFIGIEPESLSRIRKKLAEG